MTTLRWENAPHRLNKYDCFADTPRDIAKRGRWLIRKHSRGGKFVLSFNGEFVDAFNTIDAAKNHAKNNTESK